MDRAHNLELLSTNIHWDVIIIGGGATGLGAAVDAASRGYSTLLVEQEDFAKGTSSRSTKLVHGGVRYLAQGNFKLVLDALRERAYLLNNAPHVTSNGSFVIPVYKWWQKWYYAAGLVFYDCLAGRLGLGRTKMLSKKNTLLLFPGITHHKLKGGIVYRDGQFDDSRLAINLAQTATEHGATVINYLKADSILKTNKLVSGIHLTDKLTLRTYTVAGRVVINATGVFADAVMKLDQTARASMIMPSQGVHIVLDKHFFQSGASLMVPETSDGRVLFAVPWHDKVVVGTTDTLMDNIKSEPVALASEIDFILCNLNRYLALKATLADIRSVFAGLRPLVKLNTVNKTALLPRDHSIIVSASGLITITGGKWTTYRKMAEQVVDKAMSVGGLAQKECVTRALKIHGWSAREAGDPLSYYGSDLALLKELHQQNPEWQELLHPRYPYTKACVVLAVRNEMAMTAEDVLARRTRLLFLDARAAIQAANIVIPLMAQELKRDDAWVAYQRATFLALAKQYLPAFTNP